MSTPQNCNCQFAMLVSSTFPHAEFKFLNPSPIPKETCLPLSSSFSRQSPFSVPQSLPAVPLRPSVWQCVAVPSHLWPRSRQPSVLHGLYCLRRRCNVLRLDYVLRHWDCNVRLPLQRIRVWLGLVDGTFIFAFVDFADFVLVELECGHVISVDDVCPGR